MHKKIIFCLLFILAIFHHGVGQTTASTTVKPNDLHDGIDTGKLAEAGMDVSVIKEITAQIASGHYPNIHSLLIHKDNKLVYESYFPGKDQRWGDSLGVIEHNPSDLHDIRSISKSAVSACIGIAIAQGKIKSVDQKVFDFFSEYAAYNTGLKKELAVKHLLTMTSGLEWNEEVPYDNPENSEIQMNRSADPVDFILSRPNTSPPGKEWKYNGGTTQLLSVIIERVTGKKVDVFANEYLFKPLGITTFEWVKPQGSDDPAAASGLRLRSRDLLKFGMLYRNKGKWNGKQIIPQDWIQQSFETRIYFPGSRDGYGYQFWVLSDTVQNQPVKIVAAVGNGDQRIYFDEKNNLLVVVTAGNYNLWNIKNNSSAILRRIYGSFSVK